MEKDSSLWTRTICELDPENMSNNRVLFRLDSSNFRNQPLEMSMTSIPYGCDSTLIYVCCQVRGLITDMDETDIYILDLKQKRLNFHCHYNSYIYGFASLDEFKASRCRLSIDLDDDDNTIKGNSYLDSVRCTTEKQSIHDNDLWIYSNARIDSMNISIDQTPDGNSETLVTYGGPANIKIVMTSPQSLELYNINNADADAFKLAMSSIKYQNTKRNYTSRNRIIRVRIYSGTRSDSADAIIYLGPPEIAGIDSTITICSQSNNTIDLFELLNNPKTTGGLWYYNGIKHNPIYDESKDAEGTYEYVIMRGNCSPDTARVIIRKYPLVKPNLGIDQYLCPMQILRIDPKVSAISYRWNDNSTDSFKLVSKSGLYSVTMTDSNGCMSSDTVEIIQSDFIKMNIDTSLCRDEILLWKNQILSQEGIYMDTLTSINSCDTILSLSLKLMDRNLSFRSVSICPASNYNYKNKIYYIGDQIIDTISASLACDTILTIDVKAHNITPLKINADSLICTGKTTSISTINSYTSYRWSSGEQNNSITKPAGTYTLTVTDQNGCIQSSSITIKEAPAVDFTVEKTDPLCPEDLGSIRIIKTNGGFDPIRFTINGQSTSSTQIDQLTPGKYIITGIDALGCMTHDTVEIIAAQKWNPSIKNTYTLDAGTSLLINFDTLGIKQVIVSPNDHINRIDDLHIVFSPEEDSHYLLTMIDENGCEYVQEIKLIIQRKDDIYMPNIFSPNGDNINDEWKAVIGSSLNIESLKIYDRWGSLIHATTGNTASWNGKIKGENAMPGVYVIVLNYKTSTGETKVLIQDVSLIR